MSIGTIQMGFNIAGYLRDKLLEPRMFIERYNQLVAECNLRGYKTVPLKETYPLKTYDKLTRKWLPNGEYRTIEQLVEPYPGPYVDRDWNLVELSFRCKICRASIKEWLDKQPNRFLAIYVSDELEKRKDEVYKKK